MVSFEFRDTVYVLSDGQAIFLAERLRSYAKGKLADELERATDLSGNPNWADGALAVADITEEILVGNFDGPIPLDGKAAEATFWTLRMMRGLRGDEGCEPAGAVALRDALAEHYGALQR